VVGFCEHGTEPSSSIKAGNFVLRELFEKTFHHGVNFVRVWSEMSVNGTGWIPTGSRTED
jgi:hypothetical protein